MMMMLRRNLIPPSSSFFRHVVLYVEQWQKEMRFGRGGLVRHQGLLIRSSTLFSLVFFLLMWPPRTVLHTEQFDGPAARDDRTLQLSFFI